jgi:fructokinase
MDSVLGGVEGGGTKFSCLLGRGPDEVVATRTFPTAGPAETLEQVVRFFQEEAAGHRLAAIGMACFGPIDLDPSSPTYGYVTTTPKIPWVNADVVGFLRQRLGVPVGWDTDVNGAALGERRWGAAQGADPAVYITVGTGIGGGAYVNGAPVHGLLHPEMGHLLVPRLDGDEFPGVCPYHGRCLEGVASGTALTARAGRPARELAPDDPLWELEARYRAWGVKTITDILSPQRIVLGGGVMEQRQLFPRIRTHVVALHNGYLRHPAILNAIDTYIVPPGLGGRAGVLGALELARLAVER